MAVSQDLRGAREGRDSSPWQGRARSSRGQFSGFSGNYGAALATITGPGGGSRGRGLDLLGSVGRLNANVHVM